MVKKTLTLVDKHLEKFTTGKINLVKDIFSNKIFKSYMDTLEIDFDNGDEAIKGRSLQCLDIFYTLTKMKDRLSI